MLQTLAALALAPLLISAEAALPAGTQLSYRGSVEAMTDEPAGQDKSFDLTLWIFTSKDGGHEGFWLLDEKGRGEFPWTEHFGRLAFGPAGQPGATSPALLYDRGEGRSVVKILLPWFAHHEPLAPGASWQEGKLTFEVQKAAKLGDKPVWRVEARDPYGPKRTLLVDQSSPLVLGMSEKVVMGRGDNYLLKLELVAREQLAPAQLEPLMRTADALSRLREKLNTPARGEEIAWNENQLAVLRDALPAITQSAAGTPLAKLSVAAERDLKLQMGRSDAVDALNGRQLGRKLEALSAAGLSGAKLDLADLDGRVTILHFWDYRDEPLKEPYGQVGYLDFLAHRHKASRLQVFGVAVDGRLGEAKTRPAAERSVKKLKAFMNLSYPILLDEGPLLRQFGDPRVVGAALPLFVVIGPERTVLHYHAGVYPVDRDQGLKELDSAVQQALQMTK